MHVPRCYRNDKSSHLVREVFGASARSVRGARQHSGKRRTRQSTSRPAFHNALGCLKPAGQPIRPRLLPVGRHRRQPPLFAFALKTKPAIAELARDCNLATKLAPAPVRRLPSVRQTFRHPAGGPARATIDSPSLRCGRCDQPDFPALSLRVRERPITQCASSAADSAPSCATLVFLQCRVGAKMPLINVRITRIFRETYVLEQSRDIEWRDCSDARPISSPVCDPRRDGRS